MLRIYTIGIGKRTTDAMLEQLNNNNITVLIDVRSRPYSAFKPEFNKEELKKLCSVNHINYAHWPALGGFPESEHVLTLGRVDYKKLASMPEFQKHIERLMFGAEANNSIALICSEGRPAECHRSKCIGVELAKANVEVIHIDEKNQLKTQDEVMQQIIGDQYELPGFEKLQVSKRRWLKETKDVFED